MSFIKTDLTKLANLNKSKGTGSIRKSKPEYVDFFPPCNNACPAGENIQAWLSLAQEGTIEDAWRKLTEQNPMAAIHGRVYYHYFHQLLSRKKPHLKFYSLLELEYLLFWLNELQ